MAKRKNNVATTAGVLTRCGRNVAVTAEQAAVIRHLGYQERGAAINYITEPTDGRARALGLTEAELIVLRGDQAERASTPRAKNYATFGPDGRCLSCGLHCDDDAGHEYCPDCGGGDAE